MEELRLKEPIKATEAPPTYDEATDKAPLSSDAPPSYEQLFGMGKMRNQVREARDASSNKGVFAVKFCEIVCGSVACMICLVILAALPVAMIVIGSVYLDDCQGQRIIPIWLIVFGCVSLLQTTINVVKRFFRKRNHKDEEEGDQSNYANRTGSCFESFLSIFLFVWIILGSYWVFGYYYVWRDGCNDVSNMNMTSCFCHPVPYLFSYVVLIVIYVTSCIFCLCCCCTFCIIALTATGE